MNVTEHTQTDLDGTAGSTPRLRGRAHGSWATNRKARYGTKQREVKCNRETQKTRDAGG